ncbi:MAG: ABC transporter ATP-binding protein [Deltaproteobacteria bacterium]|nr:ABC transporter ATP-binding protein [Deltaproteobacteria bacterium]
MEGILLDRINFSYGNGNAVKDFSLAAARGEFIALMGPNAAGKSTLLKLACGILKPSSGAVKLSGRDLSAYAPKERARLISYLPQTPDVNIPFRVRELVDMGLYHGGGMEPEEALRAAGLLEKASSHITELSGGERKRAFVAMLLVQGSSIFLLDEPLANLDMKYQIELIRLLKGIIEGKNISVIMALHDINMAFHFHRVCVVKDGLMRALGKPEEVITKGLIRDVFEVEAEEFPGLRLKP